MQMTGHKTPSVFHRYNIVSDGGLRDGGCSTRQRGAGRARRNVAP
jgi:hypothetical protein